MSIRGENTIIYTLSRVKNAMQLIISVRPGMDDPYFLQSLYTANTIIGKRSGNHHLSKISIWRNREKQRYAKSRS